MPQIEWSEEKNQWLQQNRGISFEEIQIAIVGGGLIDTVAHPNREQYPHQRMFIVLANEYIYQVPFVQDSEKIFLKTIIPNRKLVKKLL